MRDLLSRACSRFKPASIESSAIAPIAIQPEPDSYDPFTVPLDESRARASVAVDQATPDHGWIKRRWTLKGVPCDVS